MFASIMLVVLFVAGLFTTNLHTKKFFAWFIAFTIKNSSSFAPSSTTTTTGEKPMAKSAPTVINSKKDEIIKRVFATFDKNSDGYITKQELRISLKNIGMSMEEKEIEELIKNVDSNGDGLIDLAEFQDSFETLLNRGEVSSNEAGRGEGNNLDDYEKERDLLQEAFDVFDEDKDGLITVEELGLVLSSMGFQEACKLEDCKKMIRNVDIDGDGMVNFDEFKKMMGTGQGFMMPLSNYN